MSKAEALLAELEERSGNTVDELLRIGTGRLMMASLIGRLQETLEYIDSLAPLAMKSRDTMAYSGFLNVHGALLALGGRYGDAFKSAETEIELATTYGLSFVLPHARIQRALALWGLRNFRGCKTDLNMCERAPLAESDLYLRMNIGALRGRTHLATGFEKEAIDDFESYQHPPSSRSMEAEYFAWWALALAVAKQAGKAAALADRASFMSRRIEVSALVPWTKAILTLKSRRSARGATQEALRIALDTGNIDAFVTAYRACPELLQLLAENEANHDQLKTILERARDHSLALSVGLRLPTAGETEGPRVLTKREREVLQLVAQGLTNKEIGRTLFITEGTAKVHVRKIRQKLGARTRTEAAMRASELSD